MTLNETKVPPVNPFDAIFANLRLAGMLVAKFAIAGLLIVFAGVLTVAAAVAGLVIASIALLLRFVGRQAPGASRPRQSGWTEGDTITLEARRTDHGWRVE
ncbi:MAG: hypothetical protein AAFX86_03315 [Pseudomonadota bacterium]